MLPKIGIRPCIDGRWGGVRESLEEQTMALAKSAKRLIEENVFYHNGEHVEVVISPTTIGGGKESAICQDFFTSQNVTATLSVTPCWCYGTETMDLDPLTTKAIWGFNGTERPGAVYLAAAMASHAQRGLPAFAIYGSEVQDIDESGLTEDVKEKILRWARCAIVVGQLKGKSYVALGSVSMGIGGSFLDANMMQKYLGIRSEWVDMCEILRRMELKIYNIKEYEKMLTWVKTSLHQGRDFNGTPVWGQKAFTEEEIASQWEFVIKHYLIIKDIMLGNSYLDEIGWHEEALGKNAIFGGFQGQRQWTDWKPNADFSEAIMNSTFDHNGKKEPFVLATEGDNCNGLAMLFQTLLTHRAPIFADVRTYWSQDAVKKATGWEGNEYSKDGFMHLINSGAAALDGTGVSEDNGTHLCKRWWEVNDKDISNMIDSTKWDLANRGYFRGGGFSSRWDTKYRMPMTIVRVNMIDGIGYNLQVAEGYSLVLPDEVNQIILNRTDRTWPSTYFVPRLNKDGHYYGTAFDSTYSVMAAWGANHCSAVYGHIGKDIITLASMLRIPVSLHNIDDKDIYRPHSWSSFGTKDLESADFAACKTYGPLYK